MNIIDHSKIRYIINGEPHDKTVYNRPIRDLANQVSEALGTEGSVDDLEWIASEDILPTDYMILYRGYEGERYKVSIESMQEIFGQGGGSPQFNQMITTDTGDYLITDTGDYITYD